MIERIRKFWNSAKPKSPSLRELGYPSHEQLASIGMTGEQFYELYVSVYKVGRGLNPRDMATIILTPFYNDHPQLKPTE